MEPSFLHFSDCVVASGIRLLPAGTGASAPHSLQSLEIQPLISTVRLNVGGALSDLMEVFYHTVNAEANFMFYINPPIHFS